MNDTILSGKSHNGYPLNFDFFGHRDFYSLVNYLKYKLRSNDLTDTIIIDAILRNFGGLSGGQAQTLYFKKFATLISKHIYQLQIVLCMIIMVICCIMFIQLNLG